MIGWTADYRKGHPRVEIKCPSGPGKLRNSHYYHFRSALFRRVGPYLGAFAIFNAEMWELIHFDVERDNELIELIIERDEAFWKLVQDGTPPEKALTNPDIPPLQTGTELRLSRVVKGG